MSQDNPLVVALYLPQYYETEYNNEWWEKGYTEWVALKRAKPLFAGHYQPRVPLNENYYDLAVKDNIRWQMDLAKKYGIDGFAIYQYYSCGKKLLEVPTELIRDNPSLDLPFYLYWANESWKKTWFGQDNTVVWKQEYGDDVDLKEHFNYCLSYFEDSRYIKIEGKPVYAIYNPWAIPDVNHMISLWDTWAKEAGFSGMYFIKTIGRRDKDTKGSFSATVTREPNYTFAHDESLADKINRVVSGRVISFINKNFLMKKNTGIVMTKASYDDIWNKILKRKVDGPSVAIGAFCDWDNSPRKSYNSIIMIGATPEKFREYFLRLYRKAKNANSPMIVINAWNEWAEGAYLEPDQKSEYKYLEAIREAKQEI